jgi:hypothetical protein
MADEGRGKYECKLYQQAVNGRFDNDPGHIFLSLGFFTVHRICTQKLVLLEVIFLEQYMN